MTCLQTGHSLLVELACATMVATSAILATLVFWAGVASAQFYGPALPPSTDEDKGCKLTLGNGFDDNAMEPKGHPLLLNTSIRVYYLRDVPDSGGSFGVDMR